MLADESEHKNGKNMFTCDILLNFLNRDQYQTYHRSIAKKLKNVEAAILFDELVQRYIYHRDRNELIYIEKHGGDWFYHTQEAIEDRTILTRYAQDKGLDILKKFLLVETIKHGLPCKKYFRLNFEGIDAFLKNLSSLSTVSKLDCSPSANSVADGQQTHSLYIKEPNKEPNKEREGTSPSKSRASSKLNNQKERVERKPNVFISDDEHQTLINDYGEKMVWEAYEKLSDWKQNTPKHKWKKVDNLSIRNWVVDAVYEDKQKKQKRKNSGITVDLDAEAEGDNRSWFRNIEHKIYNIIHSDTDGVQIKSKADEWGAKIYFRNKQFKDLVTKELLKRNDK